MLFVITLFFAGLSGLASSENVCLAIIFGVIAIVTMLVDVFMDIAENDDKHL